MIGGFVPMGERPTVRKGMMSTGSVNVTLDPPVDRVCGPGGRKVPWPPTILSVYHVGVFDVVKENVIVGVMGQVLRIAVLVFGRTIKGAGVYVTVDVIQ